MKNKLFLLGALIFIFTFLSLPLAGTTLGTAQAQVQVDMPISMHYL